MASLKSKICDCLPLPGQEKRKSKTLKYKINLEKQTNREGREATISIVNLVQLRVTYSEKVALNPTYRFLFHFAKYCTLSCLSNVDNINIFTLLFYHKPLEVILFLW